MKKSPLPPAVPATDGAVYEYASIVPARYVSISHARIEFEVSQEWLDNHNIGADSIVLQRFQNTTWEILPTSVVASKQGRVLFSAESTGFSLFAISIGKSPDFLSATVAPASPAIAASGSAMPVTTRQTPVTTSAVLVAHSQPSSPIPVTMIGLIAVLGAVIAGVAIITRRWWIRRQNPALFRKD
jgi:hypothetical protein